MVRTIISQRIPIVKNFCGGIATMNDVVKF